MPQVLNLSKKILNALVVCIIDLLHITVLTEAVDILEAVARSPPMQICELLHRRIFPRVIAPIALELVLFSVVIDVFNDFLVGHFLMTFFDGFGAFSSSADVPCSIS